jgi:hypothetical protein
MDGISRGKGFLLIYCPLISVMAGTVIVRASCNFGSSGGGSADSERDLFLPFDRLARSNSEAPVTSTARTRVAWHVLLVGVERIATYGLAIVLRDLAE